VRAHRWLGVVVAAAALLFSARHQAAEAKPAPGLHPKFLVIEGDHPLTDGWMLTLPGRFNRRIEDHSLVIWRPGLTFWINVWGNDKKESSDARRAWILADANPKRRREQTERIGTLVRLTYELTEEAPEHSPPRYTSISGYMIGPAGHVQISAYCDDPDALATGYQVIRSVRRVTR
jgi:hypothetical protein